MPVEIDRCLFCERTGSNACDKSATRSLGLSEPFRVVRCTACGFRWLNPQPTNGEYTSLYGGEYFGVTPGCMELRDDVFSFYPPPARQAYEISVARRRHTWDSRLERIRTCRPGARSILDVGAGTGDFLAFARERGWAVAGVEISSSACRAAREIHSIDLTKGDAVTAAKSGQRFDVVHLSHVFEHLTDPDAELNLLGSLIADDGLLVIEIPNQFNSVVDAIYRLKNRPQATLFSIHHPYFYTPHHLAGFLERNEFQLLSQRTHLPEFWRGNWRRRVMGWVDRIADIVAARGYVIESIAAKRAQTEHSAPNQIQGQQQ